MVAVLGQPRLWLLGLVLTMPATFEIMAEVDATGFFEDESVDWRWCVANATFVHKDACEFIVHAGAGSGDTSMGERVVASMRGFGCTEGFVAAYAESTKMGAVRVLFFA